MEETATTGSVVTSDAQKRELAKQYGSCKCVRSGSWNREELELRS